MSFHQNFKCARPRCELPKSVYKFVYESGYRCAREPTERKLWSLRAPQIKKKKQNKKIISLSFREIKDGGHWLGGGTSGWTLRQRHSINHQYRDQVLVCKQTNYEFVRLSRIFPGVSCRSPFTTLPFCVYLCELRTSRITELIKNR